MYVCMNVCMCVCVYVRTYVCVRACMFVCMRISMYLFTYACICMYANEMEMNGCLTTAQKINRLLGVRQIISKKQIYNYIKIKIHKVIKYSVKSCTINISLLL